MNNLKKGDIVAIKGTDIEGEIVYASTILENNFYLIVKVGTMSLLRDSFGEIKEFFAEELDYTKEQKLHFEYEADFHSEQVNEENYYHFYNR